VVAGAGASVVAGEASVVIGASAERAVDVAIVALAGVVATWGSVGPGVSHTCHPCFLSLYSQPWSTQSHIQRNSPAFIAIDFVPLRVFEGVFLPTVLYYAQYMVFLLTLRFRITRPVLLCVSISFHHSPSHLFSLSSHLCLCSLVSGLFVCSPLHSKVSHDLP